MDQQAIQVELQTAYQSWRAQLPFGNEARTLSPPLLLDVTEEYCRADTRVLILGQETFGWGWNDKLQQRFPLYPNNYPFNDVDNLSDFVANSDAIEGLCWGYRNFSFGRYQPETFRSPFWKAFREVQEWPTVGVMWGNLSRCDFEGQSILNAPTALLHEITSLQGQLLAAELEILRPDICVFFTGPHYDNLLNKTLVGCERSSFESIPIRELAWLKHRLLPGRSFRTYHPGALRRLHKSHYIDLLKQASGIAEF